MLKVRRLIYNQIQITQWNGSRACNLLAKSEFRCGWIRWREWDCVGALLARSAADGVAAARAHASQAVSASCHCNQNFCPPSVSDTPLQIRRAPRSTATWVDVIWSILRHTVTKLWWNVFLSLVHDNMLNRTDPIHLECIRLCFLPMVQCRLDTFKDTWNHHRMRANRRNDKLSAIPNNLYVMSLCYGIIDYAFPLPSTVASSIPGQSRCHLGDVQRSFYYW